jgi:hypothetical protein
MDAVDLPADVRAQVDQIGSADVVVGLATSGPAPTLRGIASTIRAGLATHLGGLTAVVVHVGRAPSDETAAQLASGFGDLPIVHVPHSPILDASDDALAWSDAVHSVLRIGQAAEARATLMLSADAVGTDPEWPGGLAEPVVKDSCGLVLGVYQRNRYDGTLTQSLVTPFARGVFGRRFRQPLADEFACSAATTAFLLEQDVWATDLGRQGLPFWLPIATLERDIAVAQAPLGRRTVAAPARAMPLGATVGRVAAALFELAERLEAVWIDRRGSEPVAELGPLPEPMAGGAVDPERMQVGFRQGVRDLLPIWERILAPETLGDVLAVAEGDGGLLHDRLWARIVYDFLLAYRAGVMYRAHLAQSLAPLYLGRVAALVLETRSRPPVAVLEATERLGRVFEEEKPYLVDRWR